MIGVGATLNDRFTLIKELGQGDMGIVYRATDRWLGQSVAIKLLKISALGRNPRRSASRPRSSPGWLTTGSRDCRTSASRERIASWSWRR